MHLLERRVRARRSADQWGVRPCEETSGANRRLDDRRVAARRQAMTMQRLASMRLEGVDMLQIEAITYVVNGNCFAWLAEVHFGMASRFLAGSGRVPEGSADPAAAVVAGVRKKLQEWEDVLRQR